MDADTASDVAIRQSVYTGILPFQAIREMVDGGDIRATEIFGAIEADQIQRRASICVSARTPIPSIPVSCRGAA
jgi:hypothetical protein